MNDTSRKIEARELPATAKTTTNVESAIIPSSFWLGGLKINVEFDYTLIRSKSFIGEARYNKQQIVLDPSMAPLQMLEQCYYHELVHWIFYMMGEDELRNNEKLVDLFAHFLYQARVTEQKVIASTIEPSATAASNGE